MSPVSPVFHTEVTVSIGLKTKLRVGTSIPHYIYNCYQLVSVHLCFFLPAELVKLHNAFPPKGGAIPFSNSISFLTSLISTIG